VAQAAVGQAAASETTLAQLEVRAKLLPSERETRRIPWARGEIALGRGDTATAVAELMKAAAMLPVHGPVLGPPSAHGPLWYSAGLASFKAGRDADAVRLLEQLQTGYERVFDPEAYARSFYLLGQIRERQGDMTRAREQYSRFVDLWGDGDLERGWVADARKKIGR
jgi:tetratricopeptide (TPR) repeat protein